MNLEILTGSNIISLAPRRNRAHFPALAQVEAYWEGLRNGRPMPAREEVDPRGLTEALSHAFVLERIAPGLAKIRVAGQHLSDLMGMEVRGMPISAMFLPEARQTLRDHLEACFTTPATIRLTLAADTGFTRPALEAQMFLAPLRDRDGRPTRILGALQSAGKIGRAPRRFTIRAAKVNALIGDTAAWQVERPQPSLETASLKASSLKTPTQAQTPERGGLRLVYSAED